MPGGLGGKSLDACEALQVSADDQVLCVRPLGCGVEIVVVDVHPPAVVELKPSHPHLDAVRGGGAIVVGASSQCKQDEKRAEHESAVAENSLVVN